MADSSKFGTIDQPITFAPITYDYNDQMPSIVEGEIYDGGENRSVNSDSYNCDSFILADDDEMSYTDMQASLYLPSLMLSQQQPADNKSFARQSVLVSFIEKLSDDQGATLFLTICNILPSLQGPGLFTMPFAIMSGGLTVIPAFILLCILADVSGILLLECLYDISPRSKRRKRVRMDYVEIAKAVWGRKGGVLINAIVVLYMFLTNMCKVVMLGKSFEHLVGAYLPLNYRELTLLVSALLIPTTFIKRLTILAYFSLVGVIAIIGSIIAALFVLLQYTSIWSTNVKTIPIFKADGYPLALGMLLFSLLLNSILPQIEGSMSRPQKIYTALHISYTLSTVLKIVFGLLGAMTFGVSVEQIMSLNISHLNFIVGTLINCALCIYVITNFPLNITIVTEAFDNMFLGNEAKNWSNGGKYHIFWQFLTRPLLVYLHVVTGLFIPYYGIITGLVGALIGICLVYLFPFWFHLKLKWNELSLVRKIVQISCMLIGTIAGILAAYSSVSALVKAIETS